jgi:hypothetical protein
MSSLLLCLQQCADRPLADRAEGHPLRAQVQVTGVAARRIRRSVGVERPGPISPTRSASGFQRPPLACGSSIADSEAVKRLGRVRVDPVCASTVRGRTGSDGDVGDGLGGHRQTREQRVLKPPRGHRRARPQGVNVSLRSARRGTGSHGPQHARRRPARPALVDSFVAVRRTLTLFAGPASAQLRHPHADLRARHPVRR